MFRIKRKCCKHTQCVGPNMNIRGCLKQDEHTLYQAVQIHANFDDMARQCPEVTLCS